MARTVIKSRVGADGVLHLDVPLGALNANVDVHVTIEPATPAAGPASNQGEWDEFIQSTAGAWQGEFERPEQGEYEKRDELP